MTVAHPTITADHEQHDHAAIPGAHVRSPYDRMLAGFSHHVLHRPLRAYQRFAGAAILASILTACGAAFTALVARQTCPEPTERLGKNERSAHLEAGLLCRSIRSGDTLVKSAPRFRPQVTTSLPRLQSLLTAAQQFAPLTRRYPDGRDVVLKPKTQHGSQLLLCDPSASVVGKLSLYVPEHYSHDDFLSALALTTRAACSALRTIPYVPPLTYIVRPPPDAWEIEDRTAGIARYGTRLAGSFSSLGVR